MFRQRFQFVLCTRGCRNIGLSADTTLLANKAFQFSSAVEAESLFAAKFLNKNFIEVVIADQIECAYQHEIIIIQGRKL